jgi:hypothetical protein
MYRPSMVVVALGVPGTPLICWAIADGAINANNSKLDAALIPRTIFDDVIVCVPYCVFIGIGGELRSSCAVVRKSLPSCSRVAAGICDKSAPPILALGLSARRSALPMGPRSNNLWRRFQIA